MNCLFLSPILAPWGRAETWMVRLASGLQARGDRCAVVADPRSPWAEVCRDENLDFEPCPLGARWTPRGLPQLRAIFRARRPDAAIVRGFPTARLARAAGPGAAVLLKLPAPSDLTETLADRLTFRYGADRVLVDSFAVRDHYRRFPWVPPGKIVAVHTGIPVRGGYPDPARRAAARARLNLSGPDLAAGLATNLTARSRAMDALEAFARAGLGPGAKLVVMGDGPMLSELRRRAAARGLAGSVLFTGWREDAAELMWGLDFYLHTGLEDGLPRAMLEAMAAGAAVIAVRPGGAAEALRDGHDGFLAPIGDLDRLAERLRMAAADPALRGRTGAAAAARIRADFTIEAMVRRAHDALVETVEWRRMLGRRTFPVREADGWRWVRAPGFDPAALDPSAVARRLLREPGRILGPARFRRPAAIRLFRRARRLALLDTRTLPHLAAGWRTRNGRRESALIVETAGLPTAARWLESRGGDPARRKRFLAALAIWLGRRHAAGVVPHGLRAGTLLVHEQDGDWTFVLPDIERCVLRWKPSLREIAAQLLEFLESLAPLVGRADLLRFAAGYRRVRHLHRARLRRLLDRLAEAQKDRRGAPDS